MRDKPWYLITSKTFSLIYSSQLFNLLDLILTFEAVPHFSQEIVPTQVEVDLTCSSSMKECGRQLTHSPWSARAKRHRTLSPSRSLMDRLKWWGQSTRALIPLHDYSQWQRDNQLVEITNACRTKEIRKVEEVNLQGVMLFTVIIQGSDTSWSLCLPLCNFVNFFKLNNCEYDWALELQEGRFCTRLHFPHLI